MAKIKIFSFQGYRLPEENFGFDTNAHGSELDKIDESEDEETKGGEDKTKSNTTDAE